MIWDTYFKNDRYQTAKTQKKVDKRKAQAWETAIQLSQLLSEDFGVNKVILTGSLLTDRFSVDSDIDLAVEGLNPEWYFKAAAAVDHSGQPFPVDLIDLDRSNEWLRKRVAEGEVLYERTKRQTR